MKHFDPDEYINRAFKFKLDIVDDRSPKFTSFIGISEARKNVLGRIMEDTFRNLVPNETLNVPVLLNKIFESCISFEETTYCTYVWTIFLCKQRML